MSVSRRGDCVTLQKHHKHSLLMTSPLQTNLGGLSALSYSTAGLPALPHASWQVSYQTICCALSLVFYFNKLAGFNRGIICMCEGWPPACTNTIAKKQKSVLFNFFFLSVSQNDFQQHPEKKDKLLLLISGLYCMLHFIWDIEYFGACPQTLQLMIV